MLNRQADDRDSQGINNSVGVCMCVRLNFVFVGVCVYVCLYVTEFWKMDPNHTCNSVYF